MKHGSLTSRRSPAATRICTSYLRSITSTMRSSGCTPTRAVGRGFAAEHSKTWRKTGASTYGSRRRKKWERLKSYGPKFLENIVQAISRDILVYAMKTLRCCSIVAHVHDELIIEADRRMSLTAVCEQIGRTPPWA
jgi:hypothetical protein